jgi:hypothetical protein
MIPLNQRTEGTLRVLHPMAVLLRLRMLSSDEPHVAHPQSGITSYMRAKKAVILRFGHEIALWCPGPSWTGRTQPGWPEPVRPRVRVVRYACGPRGPHAPHPDRPGRSSGCPDRAGARKPVGPEREGRRYTCILRARERFPGSPPALLPAGQRGSEAPHDPQVLRSSPGSSGRTGRRRPRRPPEGPKRAGTRV